MAIDAKRGDGRFAVFARSGRRRRAAKRSSGRAKRIRGAGEILLTSIDRDGTQARLRLRADGGRVLRRVDSGDRVGRRRHVRSFPRRVHRGPRRCGAGRVDLPLFRARASATLKQHLPSTASRRPPVDMLIPSIDLRAARIVQLVQGERLAIETDDVDGWIEQIRRLPKVQLIDLDAAKGAGANEASCARSAAGFPAASAAASGGSSGRRPCSPWARQKVIAGLGAISRDGRADVEFAEGARRSASAPIG